MSPNIENETKRVKSCIPISILKEKLHHKILQDKKFLTRRQSVDSIISLNSNIYDLLDPPEFNPSYNPREICHLSEKVTRNLLRLQDSNEGNRTIRIKQKDIMKKRKSDNGTQAGSFKNKQENLAALSTYNTNFDSHMQKLGEVSSISSIWMGFSMSAGENFLPIFDFFCKGLLFILMLLYVTNQIPCPTCHAAF
ncbi:hypothetical protein HHI36_013201 [Cryptolaemus montrouzieri]|uniref:Uncharacterized protein n=1 Tax=Cryptolaemus montrouzieri TaxID=559131 RepID=A0ABD2NGM7_9CUCU